ncbi:RNA polymerase factor sigma-54 [Peptostreptococcus russellii]|uniref:RNA polymerase, sigma 54 subunit, RpoN/SigL n=1 Tax=Peptostreptococcus russellii TaxID=215200 RepID=A0A1H8GA61_9FIRM|nr:RNA polymerase factor sigma-54 [Peptostreptococcus russellii]SEN40644.1 RNA polymerase, sigma 54 subunit, RpoN/SigL [Peptostreptococcus russellii]
MALTNKIEQRQTQKLSISNRIVQSLKVLNMGRHELEEAVERESECNPLLEVNIDKNEVDWEKYFLDERKTINFDRNNVEYNDEHDFNFENLTPSVYSIYDSLYAQINIMDISKMKKKICKYLIDSLDKDGYLREDESTIVRKFGISKYFLEECIEILHGLEPAGIGARNLQECIILQLRHCGINNKKLEDMINCDINLIANLSIQQLATKYRLTKEEVVEFIEFIKSLEPKPADMSSEKATVYAYPDVYVEKVDGKSVAKAYNEKKMQLGVNSYYKNLLLSTDDTETKKYIKEKLNSAQKLINDVSERSTTVVNIANSIIDAQRDYFDKDGDLKPLMMTELAEKLNCHVSTISRGVSDKYMLTEKGMYELKDFFTNAYENEDGDVVSSNSIKVKIKSIIDNENKKKPLSDKKIEDLLKEDGIDIARRTVAKYREELGFLGSSKRKQL